MKKRHILFIILIILLAAVLDLKNIGFEQAPPRIVVNTEISIPEPDTEPDSTNFDKTIVINSGEEFFSCLTEARDRLVPSVEMKINNYSDEEYDINKLEKGKYSIMSQGKRWGSTAYMTYTFTYSESFAVTRAIEDPVLLNRLSDEELKVVRRLKTLQTELIHEGMSDYDKELTIHDYLAKNFCYDTVTAETGKIREGATKISEFLDTHTGVCEAYAFTFKALCDLSGIESHIVIGTLDGTGHVWNIVKLDGAYYHVDVTADDPLPDEPQHCFHSYFNLTDAAIQRTHTIENKQYDCTETKYDYFIYNGLVVHNKAELKALVDSELSKGKAYIVFRSNDYRLNEEDINDALAYKGFTKYTVAGGSMDDPYGDFELRMS